MKILLRLAAVLLAIVAGATALALFQRALFGTPLAQAGLVELNMMAFAVALFAFGWLINFAATGRQLFFTEHA